MKRLIFFLTLVFLVFPSLVKGAIGVGVGTGKIQVDEKLKPGIIYVLPSLSVINTGDEPADYEAAVTFNDKQDQLKPNASWFEFSPEKFHLDPGAVQQVDIKLKLPLNARPGDYFAYLEGHPAKKASTGTTIGIAAAAKLYFTVLPTNVLSGIYYRLASLWKIYSPWSERVFGGASAIIVIIFIRKFFNIEVNFKKKVDSESKNE